MTSNNILKILQLSCIEWLYALKTTNVTTDTSMNGTNYQPPSGADSQTHISCFSPQQAVKRISVFAEHTVIFGLVIPI